MIHQSPLLDATTRELNHIRHALDQSAIVAIADRAGLIVHVNDKFCEISQYSRQELLGQNHRIINSGFHSKEFFKEMWQTISSGKIWKGEIKNRAKDGSYYWVSTTIVPFLDEKGKPYQYISIRHEITQRKEAEEQLQVYARQLERNNQELQEFASVAAHDLQEPLRKIQAFGDRILNQCQQQLPAEGQDYLTRMLSSTKRMRKLIDDLLAYSRIATKALPFTTTDLNAIVQDVLSDLELRTEQVSGQIQVGQLPTIHADPSQIRQLFQNLIANALKFHKKGTSPVVQVQATLEPPCCIISISDNGIGFDEKYSDRIFTIFQRLHGRHEYEGTGVGLAICRRIVERHSGGITAKSSPDQGTVFTVTLPLLQAGRSKHAYTSDSNSSD